MALAVLALVSNVSAQSGDFWETTSSPNFRSGLGAPVARSGHLMAMANGKPVVWGGAYLDVVTNQPVYLNSGGVYDPATDSWEFRPNLSGGVGAPSPRSPAAVVFVSGRIVVIGGKASENAVSLANGGEYDLATDTWLNRVWLNYGSFDMPKPRAKASLAVAHDGRAIIWGGNGRDRVGPNNNIQNVGVTTGGVWSVLGGDWVVIPALSDPAFCPSCTEGGVWLGDGFIGWSGFPPSAPVTSAGGRFDMATNSWASVPGLSTPVPGAGRWFQTAVWSGEVYIIHGGKSEAMGNDILDTGNVYDPDLDAFISAPDLNLGTGAPTPRWGHAAVWTGTHMLVWGGGGGSQIPFHANGGLYDPRLDAWIPSAALTVGSGKPDARDGTALGYDGDRLFVWGGRSFTANPAAPPVYLIADSNTGFIYSPPRVAPSIESPVPMGNTPSTWSQGGTPPGGAVVAVGQIWRHRVTAYGCPVPSIAFTGLAPWMNVEMLATGAFLSGTPQSEHADTAAFITVFADNGIGTFASQSFTISVGSPAAQIAFSLHPPLVRAYLGLPYSHTATNNGPVPTSVSVSLRRVTHNFQPLPPAQPGFPGWPEWLSWDGLTLSGTPQTDDIYRAWDVTIMAVSGGIHGAQRFQLDVRPPLVVSETAADVNADTGVDIVDVQLLVNWILALSPVPGPTPSHPTAGDVNGDSARDIVDVQAVVNYILYHE